MTQLTQVSLSAVLLGFFVAGSAGAQDPTPIGDKKPNVLLIVDTSGSMEYKTGSDTYPTCNPGNTLATNERSRWIEVLEVLTGTIDGYSCDKLDRSTSNFISEFKMQGGASPPDANYRNPYHRPLSFGCAITPDRNTVLTNAFDWAAPLERVNPVNLTSPVACNFQQQGNGFIDTYNDQARFGLMTYDPLPDGGTGHAGSPGYEPNYPQGVDGTWSYFGSGSPAQGKPADCLTLQTMEVGVRNGAAPASEGKMIYFGGQDLTDIQDMARHDRLQKVLLATRPYGATPINGALNDARNFFWEDDSPEPTGSSLYDASKLSPRFDEYVECGCREQHVILITDGEPNLDMRPDCEAEGIGTGGSAGVNGVCPYPETPEEILADMSGKGTTALACSPSDTGVNKYQILTHVVGYSTPKYAGGTKDCATLQTDSPYWNDPGGFCQTNSGTDEDLKVCCTLHRLAVAGGTGTPSLAPDGAALQAALGNIMKEIVATTATATQPARSPGVGLADDTGSKAYRLLTSYKTGTGTSGLWGGVIERLRWTCDDSNVPQEQEKDPALGDDFVTNVTSHMADREFVTFVPSTEPSSTVIYAARSVRPWVPNTVSDGVGTRGGTQTTAVGSSFAGLVNPEALAIKTTDAACLVDSPAADVAGCAARVLGWTLGYDSGTGRNRCMSAGDPESCSVIGDILHSTPTIVNRPTAAVEDESYESFATGAAKNRPMMALMSSNDGILHGFNLSPNSTNTNTVATAGENNEYFAFLPPAILPQLKNQYPQTRMKLLDGVAVVQDVVATQIGTTNRYLLERSSTNAQELGSTWRTIMVQSFGGERGGYFALDITDPRRPSGGTDPGTGAPMGPQFLWQLTTTDAPAELFGKGGTPLITTVNLGGKEVAVAVLPGGRGGSPTGSACNRSNPDRGTTWNNTGYSAALTGFSTATYEPRTQVNCYNPADIAARSLTVVRLDSGEIVRTFRRTYNATTPEVPGLVSATIFATPTIPGDPYLDSPITGVPAAFPSGVGMVADRIFVGDQDGGLWRVDLSDPNARNWTMELFFDAYAEDGPLDGKPLTSAPVLSIDDRGQITVNFATGDQDLSGAIGDNHYVFSLTEAEHPSNPGFYAKINWAHKMENGEHVVGPLTLFGGVLYFSSVDPSSSNACTNAQSSIWGVDYILPERLTGEDEDSDPFHGGKARLQVNGSTSIVQERTVGSLVSDNGDSPVFGVSLEFVPSCSPPDSGSVDTLISGSRTAVTQPSASQLQLVFQGAGTTGGDLGFETTFQAVTLAPPKTASSILSWAAILD